MSKCVAGFTTTLASHLSERLNYLGKAVTILITGTLDTLGGILAGIFYIASCGKWELAGQAASSFLGREGIKVLAVPFEHLVEALHILPVEGLLIADKEEIFAPTVRNYLKKSVESNRVMYVVQFMALAVARLGEAIIGIVGCALSACALLSCQPLNTWAYRGLRATGIFNDCFECTTKLLKLSKGSYTES